jgi:hypothetical protein
MDIFFNIQFSGILINDNSLIILQMAESEKKTSSSIDPKEKKSLFGNLFGTPYSYYAL